MSLQALIYFQKDVRQNRLGECILFSPTRCQKGAQNGHKVPFTRGGSDESGTIEGESTVAIVHLPIKKVVQMTEKQMVSWRV